MKPLTLLLIALSYHILLAAQPKADFTTTDGKLSGCSPLTVLFKNTTTGASINATYKWTLGNNNVSTLQNPGAVYTTEKTYSITLTVTDGNYTSSKTLDITVYKKPVVDFIVTNGKGCLPITTTFTSTASAGDGTISNYFWDFGDGTTINSANASTVNHDYATAINPKIDLIVTNSYGCQNAIQKTGIVDVRVPAVAAFTANKTTICNTNTPVIFTNTSTGTDSLSYVWDFGDSTTSTQKNPSHTYTTKGNFNVQLIANSAYTNGCSSVLIKAAYVQVPDFKSDFTVPSALCVNDTFAFTSQGIPNAPTTAIWRLSDESFARYALSFTKTFTVAGNYNIRLINCFGVCRDTLDKQLVVNPLPNINNFVVGNTIVCSVPTTVEFSDTSKGAAQWQWTVTTPAGTKTSNWQTPTFTFNDFGTYNVSLNVKNTFGCKASTSKNITVQKPAVVVTVTNSTSVYGLTGCPGFKVSFAATPASLISSYTWVFGDGTSTTNATPTHLFDSVGSFTIKLYYTTTAGCKDSTILHSNVIVFKKPVVNFNISATEVCGNTTVKFTDSSSQPVDRWYWEFGDKEVSPLSNTNSVVEHRYNDSGVYTIRLIAFNGTCSDSIEKKTLLKVLPPFIKIEKVTNTCDDNRSRVSFQYSSKLSNTLRFDYGDGSIESVSTTLQQHTHNYANTGTYFVKLIAENGKCTANEFATINVLLKQSPVLAVNKDEICTSDSLSVLLNGLEMNPSKGVNGYGFSKWQYNDSTDFAGKNIAQNAAWSNAYAGTLLGLKNKVQSIRVVITSANFGCSDTSNFVKVKTKGPTAVFSVLNNNNCFKTPFIFLDSSFAGADTTTIVTRQWSFGDGSAQSFTNNQSFTHIYNTPAGYAPVLKVTDNQGCFNTTAINSVLVVATGPKANFSYAPSTVTAGTTVNYASTSNLFGSATTQYDWQFSSNNATLTGATVPHYYANNIAIDTVRMIAKNTANQCADTLVQMVTILQMHTAFTFTSEYITTTNCPPLAAYFTANCKNITDVKWDFGDGSGAGNLLTPSHTYRLPGIYKIALYSYNNNRFVDSAVDYITVKGPYATALTTNVTQACKPSVVTLSAATKNAVEYVWDFGDGLLSPSSADTFATHTYTAGGFYQPALIMKDAAGCSAVFQFKKSFLIDTLYAAIKPSNNVVCNKGSVAFTALANSISSDSLKQALKYHWSFGTNATDTSNLSQALFNYTLPGKHPVTLQVKSASGCVINLVDTILVQPSPKSVITGPSDICEGVSAEFKASSNVPGNITWTWSFTNNGQGTNQSSVAQVFSGATVQKVVLISMLNGCYDTTSTILNVHAKPVVNITPTSKRICLGDSVQLNAYDGTQFEWTPTLKAINNPFAAPKKSTNYTVKVTNSFGCASEAMASIDVVQPFKLQAKTNIPVCTGNTTTMDVSGAASYQWINNNSELNNSSIANPTVTPKQTTIYKVVGYDAYKCFTDTASVGILVKPLPIINAGADITTGTGSVVNLKATNSSNDVVQWNWFPTDYLNCTTCPSPISTPRGNISYSVTATTQWGCVAKDSVKITLQCVQGNVFIPTAFTPNKDGLNDTFYPLGKGIKTVKRFVIYNRAGQVIFEKANFNLNDKSAGWKGMFNGYEAPSGVYVYAIELLCDTDETFAQKGTVTLIR